MLYSIPPCAALRRSAPLCAAAHLSDERGKRPGGASWEGFAIEQTLLAHGEHDAYFYRTQRGAELDLMLLRGGKRFGFEFKCSDAPRTTRSMHVVLDDLGLAHLWVIYPGDLEYPLSPLSDRITALPLKQIPDLQW